MTGVAVVTTVATFEGLESPLGLEAVRRSQYRVEAARPVILYVRAVAPNVATAEKSVPFCDLWLESKEKTATKEKNNSMCILVLLKLL